MDKLSGHTLLSKKQFDYLLTEFDRCGILYSYDEDFDGIPNMICRVARDHNCEVIIYQSDTGCYLTELGLSYIQEFIINFGGVA